MLTKMGTVEPFDHLSANSYRITRDYSKFYFVLVPNQEYSHFELGDYCHIEYEGQVGIKSVVASFKNVKSILIAPAYLSALIDVAKDEKVTIDCHYASDFSIPYDFHIHWMLIEITLKGTEKNPESKSNHLLNKIVSTIDKNAEIYHIINT